PRLERLRERLAGIRNRPALRTTPVAAVTAGLAKLSDRSMSSYANEFLVESQAVAAADTVEEVANNFLRFVRTQYERHYADSKLPEEYRDAPGRAGLSRHSPA
ncbi:MAG TPA: hypothetical protein VJ011_00860, partial [Steroidobacteraceae bacterium]|nr:hypothetical protein [Steroidobacteraceae bacterium]